jgi:hypothetical protein
MLWHILCLPVAHGILFPQELQVKNCKKKSFRQFGWKNFQSCFVPFFSKFGIFTHFFVPILTQIMVPRKWDPVPPLLCGQKSFLNLRVFCSTFLVSIVPYPKHSNLNGCIYPLHLASWYSINWRGIHGVFGHPITEPPKVTVGYVRLC